MISHKDLTVGTELYHPCSIDIIKHKIIAVTTYEDRVVYHSKAVHGVGACGEVEVELVLDQYGALRFIAQSDTCEYGSGLHDFVEGRYYTDINDARVVFYDAKETLARARVKEAERKLEDAKALHDTIARVVAEARKCISEKNDKEI